MAGEKTEKATPKRKDEERKKGNVFQSQEVVTVLSLLTVFFALRLLGPFIISQITGCIEFFFTQAGATNVPLETESLRTLFFQSVQVFFFTVMPLLLVCSLTAVVLTMAQTRLLVSGKSMAFKMSRLNPLQGIKKMFSLRSVLELVKALIKITVLGYIAIDKFQQYLPKFLLLIDMQPLEAILLVGDFVWSLTTSACIIFVFLAAADYLYQWWDYEKNLRMSKQEVKEEYKQTEGDPQVKGKIKERQRSQSMNRMMQKVPQADVVIRNPTHYAVAIGYDSDNHRAPVVLAKGQDLVAKRIVALAEENGVTTIENKPLARGLFEAVDLDREIPEQFYQPVAEVLAFVYSLKKKDLK